VGVVWCDIVRTVGFGLNHNRATNCLKFLTSKVRCMSPPPRVANPGEASVFLETHPDVLFVDLLIADMNGVVRGKRIERNSLIKVYEKGINLPASLFALDINGSTVESTGLGLDIGDADRICLPIPNTLSCEPWQKRP